MNNVSLVVVEGDLLPLARSSAAAFALFKAAQSVHPGLTAIKVVGPARVYSSLDITFMGAKHG